MNIYLIFLTVSMYAQLYTKANSFYVFTYFAINTQDKISRDYRLKCTIFYYKLPFYDCIFSTSNLHVSPLQTTRTCSCVGSARNSLTPCRPSCYTRGSSVSPASPRCPQCPWPPPTPTHRSPPSARGHRLLTTDR